jgi:Fe-S oxidoreductase
VYGLLRKNGVRRVITVDPHTTDMLRSVYPKIITDYDIEVTNYLELLANMGLEPERRLDRDVVIHDSCVYARYEAIVEQPRILLGKAGLDIREPEHTKNMTYCCGGPIESLFPKKSHTIAENRLEQLRAMSNNIVTMCPICLINLRHAAEGYDVSVKDISQYLMEAYCDEIRPQK